MSQPNFPISSSTLSSELSSENENEYPLPAPAGPPPRKRYWLHALLLVATCFTTLIMGARMHYNFAHNQPALTFSDERVDYFPWGWLRARPERVLDGFPFAATVMLFFLAHELGHYITCRRYGVYATLPFFIPAPTPIGTMGAVILIRSPIRSRTALFDIAIAGPIAGFVVAVVALAASLTLSKPLPHGAAAPDYDLTFPLIFTWTHDALVWCGLLRGGAAMPLNRVLLHPTAIAAWVGMFATALNLLPGGQLDGGHIIYALAPRAHKIISRITIVVLLVLAYYLWAGWLVWAILLQLSSFRHPQVADLPRVSGKRAWLAVFALVMLALTLTPAPAAHLSTPEVIRQMRQP
jgi:membrane-associated protease RseP (regulator of RpoE activity)